LFVGKKKEENSFWSFSETDILAGKCSELWCSFGLALQPGQQIPKFSVKSQNFHDRIMPKCRNETSNSSAFLYGMIIHHDFGPPTTPKQVTGRNLNLWNSYVIAFIAFCFMSKGGDGFSERVDASVWN
jgi:hypothetical protein